MPEISIIVPVYKVEEYLDSCVESILSQTFSDFELILVDDGSPDRCGQMCDEWAQKDERIKVIHKENGGLSSARNAGLEIAAGEYIGFVDSDDTIHPQMYELLHYYAKKDGSELVGQQKFPSIKKEIYDPITDGSNRIVVSARKVLENFHNEYYNLLWTSIPIKLFHRNIFQQLRFREGIIYEDDDIFPRIVYSAHQITIIQQHLYNYMMTPNSIMRSAYSSKRYMELGNWQRHTVFFHELGLEDQRDYYAVKSIYRLMVHYKTTRYKYPDLMTEFKPYIKEFCKFKPFIRKHCKLSRLQRVLLEIFPAFPGMAIKLHEFLDK